MTTRQFAEGFGLLYEPVPECGCWLWLGGASAAEYGITPRIDGEQHYVHRLMVEITAGPISDGLEVRHSCDTPLCCNPRHLLTGTHAENMQDMAIRGRSYGSSDFGEDNHSVKLSESDVLEIRKEYPAGQCTLRQLGEQYGITEQAVWRIIHRKTWPHLSPR